MTAEDWRRVKEVLADVLALPEEKREGWLAEQLADEEEIAIEVRSLLAAHGESGALLEPPGAGEVASDELEPGERIGVYRVLREIGRGGMGVVYLAERDDDSFDRQVALKLILHGAAGRELEQRFLRERRILARLDHPGIARLLDGGTTEDGRPYLVMEHVEGEPIDVYCQRHGLGIDARLELFLEICSAVDFAHRNLVVHRDLKPSNVLVDSSGRPKLLDFGIAKLLDAELAGEAPATRIGLVAMTPEYASPEQIRGDAITTATDVYALGVMLYELLTGRRPFDLSDRALPEVARVVCEEDPPSPSSVARSVASEVARGEVAAGGASAGRDLAGMPPSRREVARRVRGDLDAMILKALRKEPEERYASADQLAADLRRHREGQPVLARRGSLAYRATKLVRRHRLAVAASAAFVLLLLAFAISMALQVARTTRALARAEDEGAKAAAVQAFLEETLDAANPQSNDGRSLSVAEALDRARERLGGLFAEQPEIEAAVQHLIGKLYSNMGRYEDAEPLLRQALATRRRLLPAVDDDLAESLESLGVLLGRTGRASESEPLFRQAQAMREELHGHWNVDVAKDLDLLAHVASVGGDPSLATELERKALEVYRRVLGERDPSVAHALSTVAGFERANGDLEAAEATLREAVGILDGLPDVPLATRAELGMDLGELFEAQGRYEDAEREVRDSLAAYRRVFGEEHHWVAQGLVRLGRILTREGRYDEAEQPLREGVAMLRRVLDPGHPEVAIGLENLAFLLGERGDVAQAEELLETVLEMQRSSMPDNPLIGATLQSLGTTEMRLGRYGDARRHLQEALSIHRRSFGEDHPRTARSRLALGSAVGHLGDWTKAEEMQREALETLESTYEEDHPRLAEERVLYAESLIALDRLDEAEALLSRALSVLQRVHGTRNRRVRRVLEDLATVADGRGRTGEAAAYRARLVSSGDEGDEAHDHGGLRRGHP